MIVGLVDLKLYLDVDHHWRDGEIDAFGMAAQAQVQSWIGRPIYASAVDLPGIGDPGYDPLQIVADARIVVSIKVLVRRMYYDRDGLNTGGDAAIPPLMVRALLDELRVFHRLDEGEGDICG